MWWLSKIRSRPEVVASELRRAAQRRDTAQAEAKRRNAHKVERARARCTAQLAFLEELRPWATRNQMWFDDNHRKVRRFEVGPIGSYTLYFYEDGAVEAFWQTYTRSGRSSMWLMSDDVRLWNWLRTVSTTDLLAGANKAGWLRGAGEQTAG